MVNEKGRAFPDRAEETPMASIQLRRSLTSLLFVCVVAQGCASGNQLRDYEFSDATIAGVYDLPPGPEVLTGPYFYGHGDDPIQALLRAGSRIAAEVQAESVRDKIDAANDRVDAPARLADRTLDRTSRILGATPTTEVAAADYLLEVNVRDYGIDAEGWDAAAHFFINADAVLLERATGVEVWSARVREDQILTPQVIGQGRTTRDVISAAALAILSVDELTLALERLSDYCADEITGKLRADLLEARGR